MHEVTPLAFQNTVVREPSGTDAGTAHISAFGSTYGSEEVAAGFVVTVGFAGVVTLGFVTVGAAAFTTAGVVAGVPTAYPRNWHKLSKNAFGIIEDKKLVAHGRP